MGGSAQRPTARFTRVKVRLDALPALEAALGPGVAEALARTAAQVQEDAAALDALAEEQAPELAELAEGGIALPVDALAANPPALRAAARAGSRSSTSSAAPSRAPRRWRSRGS